MVIWKSHIDPLLNERDYMELAYRLAIMNPLHWQDIISTQRDRLKTEDLRKEFDYVSRACHPDKSERVKLFNALLLPENRLQEPWAIHTLRLLNSDVFEPQSNAYIEPSLKSLEYIQQTSDIFFPGRWMNALMAEHKSKEAAQIVDDFIKANPDYPTTLRNKILEASWILMKQEHYVEKPKPVVAANKKK
jgi:aminopeptidase N